jgi:dihydroflavonol-4-reductase
MKTIFVTGGTGFIGKHLVRQLAARGISCHCLVRKTSDTSSIQQPGVSLVYGSVDRPETYAQSLSSCDAVIHLAGLTQAFSRDELYQLNGQACGQLADACIAASVSRMVYISSLAAAGPPPAKKLAREETDLEQPVSDYGRSKLDGESQFRKRAAQLQTTVIRPGVVYGPGDKNFGQLVSSVVRMHLHLVVGFRTPKISLIHVDDLVSLIIAAIEKGEVLSSDPSDPASRSHGIYFACDDSEFVTYADLGRRIAKSANTRVLVWPIWKITGYCIGWLSEILARLRGKASILNRDKIREATVWSWACSSQKARTQLGFKTSGQLDSLLPEVIASYVK